MLKPFPHNGVDGEPVVFATPDILFALAMIHGTGNELAVGYFVDLETRKEEMYIDELMPDVRLIRSELISKSVTPVISETSYPSILAELKKYNINFVGYENVLIEMQKRGKDPKKATILYKSDRFVN